jgi:hypothetical protein
MTGYINVMLVLQSCSGSLHIPPGSSNKTNATSDGVCNFSNTEVEEDVDVIEEVFIPILEEVDRGIKQEEIPGDITFPDVNSEPDEVSYVCICVLLDTFYQSPGIFVFFLCHYFWPIETASLLVIKMFCCLFFWCVCVCVGGSVCTRWVCQHVIA